MPLLTAVEAAAKGQQQEKYCESLNDARGPKKTMKKDESVLKFFFLEEIYGSTLCAASS